MLSLNINPNITIIEFRTSFSAWFLYIYFRIENGAIKNEAKLAELITKDSPDSFDISETMTIKEFENSLSKILNKKVELFYQKTGKRMSYVRFSDDKRDISLKEANEYAKSQGADNLEAWVKTYHNFAIENEKSQQDEVTKQDKLQNVNVEKENAVIIQQDKENEIGNTQSNSSVNNLLQQSLVLEEAKLLKSIYGNINEITREMTFLRFCADETLPMVPEEFYGALGDFEELNDNLIKYKKTLKDLSNYDNSYAIKSFKELDETLDKYDMDFRDWVKKAETNRKDKRKVSNALKDLKLKATEFHNIFENYSYNGWVG